MCLYFDSVHVKAGRHDLGSYLAVVVGDFGVGFVCSCREVCFDEPRVWAPDDPDLGSADSDQFVQHVKTSER